MARPCGRAALPRPASLAGAASPRQAAGGLTGYLAAGCGAPLPRLLCGGAGGTAGRYGPGKPAQQVWVLFVPPLHTWPRRWGSSRVAAAAAGGACLCAGGRRAREGGGPLPPGRARPRRGCRGRLREGGRDEGASGKGELRGGRRRRRDGEQASRLAGALGLAWGFSRRVAAGQRGGGPVGTSHGRVAASASGGPGSVSGSAARSGS